MEAREPSRMPSPDPPNMTTGSNSYAAGVQSSPMTGMASSLPNNMHFSFNSLTPPSAPKPMGSPGALYHGDGSQGLSSGGGMLPMTEPVKKKRGRPRKYGPDGTMALALSPLSSVSGYSNSSMSEPSAKRRGRPPGSGKKQQMDALGSAGIAFTPHVITVKAGEDVASKIMAFSQQGSRTVCILSANGSISNVTLRQPATSGGTVTYEGRFEIISLSGSYLLTEDGGTRSRTGGLSVALAGSDGRVLGGVVAGMLMAAAPVQVVVGSFIAEGRKPKLEPIRRDPSAAPPQMPVLPLKREAPPVPLQMTGFGTASASSPPSQGTTSDDDSGSPNEHSGDATCNNNSSQLVQSVPPYASVGWPNSIIQHRHEPEVKMMNN